MEENEVMMTEESVENQEVAEPEVDEAEVTEESENTQEVADPETQSKEQNAMFANMRRQAEAESQRRRDKEIAELCKDVTHPITGKPITTFAEYKDALAAQNRLQAEAQLKENGVDVSILDDYVKASPVLMEAERIVQQNQQAQAEAQLKEDFAVLQTLNSDLKTFEDIVNDPRFNDIVAKVQAGASLVDAYKIVNFDVLMSKGTKSAHQQAINQAKGKSHLEPTESISENDDAGISETMLHALKANFPDKSDKEIRKLYKQTFK